MRSERRQTVFDELTQSGQGLRAGDRPRAIGVGAERRRRKPFDHREVDVVEFEPRDRRPGSTVARWRLSVVVVEVPSAADRLGAVGAFVDEHPEPQSLPTIEVLHRQPLAVGRPAREVVVVAEEPVAAHQLDTVALRSDRASQLVGSVGDDDVDTELLDVVAQALLQRVRSAVVDVETFGSELGCEVGHGRQDEMEPLAVPPSRGDQGCALDEQDATVARHPLGERSSGSAELVAEHPHGGDGRSGHRGSLAHHGNAVASAPGLGRVLNGMSRR